jgi:hypothetical protein
MFNYASGERKAQGERPPPLLRRDVTWRDVAPESRALKRFWKYFQNGVWLRSRNQRFWNFFQLLSERYGHTSII